MSVPHSLGLVFQHFNLFPHLAACWSVIEGPRTILKLPRNEVRARVTRQLAKVGLVEKGDAYPSHLSSGQK